MWISAIQLVREAKEQRKHEKEAQRDQAKRNQELKRKAKITVSRKITALEAKIRSQTEAATRLDCVVSGWQKERI